MKGTVKLTFDDGSVIEVSLPGHRRLFRVQSDLGDGVDVELRKSLIPPLPRGVVLRALLDMRIDAAGFSVRATNALFNAGIRYIGQLVSLTERALLKMKNVSRPVFNEIVKKLAGLRLSLEMSKADTDGWSADGWDAN